jgi:YVTN family beta-propeller protein
LEAVIPVGALPLGILWNPASNKVYTVNNYDYTVSVIDGASNQVVATVGVADEPMALCWNSVHNKVYCASIDPDWLSVIDGAGDTLIRKVRMRGQPTRMVYNPMMDKLYVVCFDDQMIRVYDGAADTLVAEILTGNGSPHTLLWHQVSNRMFCPVSDSMFVIDCVSDQVVSRLRVGEDLRACIWNPASNLVYAAGSWDVYALSAGGDSVVATIPGSGKAPWQWSVCHVPYPNKLYVGDFNLQGVVRVDCNTQSVYDTILGGQQINDLLCDSLHGKVYVVGHRGMNQDVYVFDAGSDALIKSIHAANDYEWLAWNPTNSRVYVADQAADAVFVIRDTTTGVEESPKPQAVRFKPAATVVRNLPAGALVFDAMGRRVTMPKPGVYFVVTPRPDPLPQGERGNGAVTVRKVIVQR